MGPWIVHKSAADGTETQCSGELRDQKQLERSSLPSGSGVFSSKRWMLVQDPELGKISVEIADSTFTTKEEQNNGWSQTHRSHGRTYLLILRSEEPASAQATSSRRCCSSSSFAGSGTSIAVTALRLWRGRRPPPARCPRESPATPTLHTFPLNHGWRIPYRNAFSGVSPAISRAEVIVVQCFASMCVWSVCYNCRSEELVTVGLLYLTYQSRIQCACCGLNARYLIGHRWRYASHASHKHMRASLPK